VTLIVLLACGVSPSPQDTAGLPADDTAAALPDPFAARPDASGGLTNVSNDLDVLLERGALHDACDRYRARPDDQELRLLCGKALFFYETFDTAGVPTPLVDFLLNNMQDQVGPGFSAYGLIPDPTSTQGLPLGMAPSVDNTYAFTCASCHFAELPDGRYAVGAPNHDYEYGAHNLSFSLVPMSLTGTDGLDPQALATIAPLLDALDADWGLKAQLGIALLGLLGTEVPEFPADVQRHYATWKPGTMDFLIEPLPIQDDVHTVSRIPALWGLPTVEEQELAGMDGALLGWTGNTPTSHEFVYWFGVLGGGSAPSAIEEDALAAYLESLDAPDAPTEPDPRGHAVFVDHCLDCHQGPRGSGLHVYSYDEIGTDPTLGLWMDADGDGQACCEETLPGDFLTGGIKSPRLVGLWAQQRFLHNGSVESLHALLCVTPREDVTAAPYGDQGHTYGCELPEADRRALVAYLNAH
jgi:hypothetical protein